MAKIAITLADMPNGKVDIAMYIDEATTTGPQGPAETLAKAMLLAAKELALVNTPTEH